MPIKIFAAPGDHKNDFESVEEQVNAWIARNAHRVVSIQSHVNAMPSQHRVGDFIMTVVVHYESQEP